MSYTEVKERNGRKYYYRVRSVREEGKVRKKRVYLGKDIKENLLSELEVAADRELGVLESLLSDGQLERLDLIRRNWEEQPESTWENRYEVFVGRFTHDSTAIEGNTLTLAETSTVLFDGIAPGGGTIREVREVLNHRKAFDHLLARSDDIDESFIMSLHHHVMYDLLDSQLGTYRTVQVYIRGTDWMPAGPEDVPGDMRTLLKWYSRYHTRIHPLLQASYMHIGFETIHPFVDGNGRVGRLLLNFVLHRNGYPMVNIPNSRRFDYYDALEKGRLGDIKPFMELMITLLETGQVMF